MDPREQIERQLTALTAQQDQALEDLDTRLDDIERLANDGFTGSEHDRLLVQLVAAYAEGQVRYGRAVRLLDEVESNALQGKAPVPPNIEVFQVPSFGTSGITNHVMIR